MGPFPPVISCQVAVTPGHDQLGGKPFLHVDGSWSGSIPGDPQDRFLDYPEHHDPCKTSIDAQCDHWCEWDGVNDVVAAACAGEW